MSVHDSMCPKQYAGPCFCGPTGIITRVRAQYVNPDCAWGQGECIPNCPSCTRMNELYNERRRGYEEGRKETEAPEEGFNW